MMVDYFRHSQESARWRMADPFMGQAMLCASASLQRHRPYQDQFFATDLGMLGKL
jgi:hypothetical protein